MQFPWNVQQSLALQPPYIKQKEGLFKIEMPREDGTSAVLVGTGFKSASDFFDFDVRAHFHSELKGLYQEIISRELGGRENLGALLIEPVCQGAGGMKFVDPLWQRELVLYCRKKKIPVIFDEIFVGLYRLGFESTKDLLGLDPDIACYGKLLTGGTVPLPSFPQ